ncbi:MAG: tetratricopeptide repeat protein [Thermoguttaceae bacterium]|nr:tetratricopeptide repeat protein [Thermoguttaceae bacterium]
MTSGVQDFDVKQAVLYGGSFGPREIDELRGEISRDMKKFDELRETVNELKTKDEDELSPAAQVKLGVCFFLIGEYDAAYNALKKGDGGALAHFYFAKIHYVKGEYEEAVAAYKTAQSAGYNVDVCALGRAEVFREMGNLEESLQELDYISGPTEQTAEYLYQRAATVGAIGGNAAESIRLYERAMEADPNHPGALFGLALENDRRGNDEDALALYQRAAAYFPSNVGTLMNLGILYEDMERYDQAILCFQRVLDSHPTNTRARLYLKDARASQDMRFDEGEVTAKSRRDRILAKKITDFDLDSRVRGCLDELNIVTVRDLVQYTEADLLACKNFGETSLDRIKELLRQEGEEFKLGMQLNEESRRGLADMRQESEEEKRQKERLLEEMDLSVRARKCMTRLKIQTIGELVAKSADELLACKNFGVTSLKEIREKLTPFGLKLKGD